MNRIVRAAFLACLLWASCVAPATADDPKMPAATRSDYVAMLYERMTNPHPEFGDWIRQMPEYKNAAMLDKQTVFDGKADQLKDAYNRIIVVEPVVVSANVRISPYSAMGGGFLVQSFNDITFFHYDYLGRRYALIPQGITGYQWLKAPVSESPRIMRETGNGSRAHLVLSLMPFTADAKPMEMEKREYRLIMAEIVKIEMWSGDGKRILWDSTMNAPSTLRSKLLNMYNR